MLSQNAKVGLLYTVFALLLVFGSFLFLQHNRIPNYRVAETEGSQTTTKSERAAIKNIATISQWNMATQKQRVVLFVDADCNGWTRAFRSHMDKFSDWHSDNYKTPTIFVDTSPSETLSTPRNITQSLFDHLQILWHTHDVPTGALKSIGGAGTVAWLDNGVIVDHEFIGSFRTVDEMIARTETAFAIKQDAR